ncbi:MAG: rhodanese-like domain-containing protein [Cytophagales bacterium]|nr:rhodanese-like domain-containing protein [Cytophagales bacterium]
MKLRNTITILMLLALATTIQAQPNAILSVTDFEKEVASKTEKIILDVRTPGEYKSGHLAEATLMNVNDSNFKQQISTLQKNKPVYVYCAAGVRSNKAAKILKQEGFTQVFELSGGIQAWQAAGKPVVK